MGQQKQKESRYQRLLKDHPACCFCGGDTASTTVDHVPPQACFPPGFFPEGFEFPACASCNGQSKKDDQIFAYYAQLGDPNLATKDTKSILRLQNGIRNNYKEALPNLGLTKDAKKDALQKMGIQPPPEGALDGLPIIGTSEDFLKAATTIGRKLACALYYKQTNAILSDDHFIWTMPFHLPNPNSHILAEYLAKLLPDEHTGGRTNIKEYGNRFFLKFGYKPKEDFFVSASQFGHGFVVLSIIGRRDAKYGNIPAGELYGIFPKPQIDVPITEPAKRPLEL